MPDVLGANHLANDDHQIHGLREFTFKLMAEVFLSPSFQRIRNRLWELTILLHTCSIIHSPALNVPSSDCQYHRNKKCVPTSVLQ